MKWGATTCLLLLTALPLSTGCKAMGRGTMQREYTATREASLLACTMLRIESRTTGMAFYALGPADYIYLQPATSYAPMILPRPGAGARAATGPTSPTTTPEGNPQVVLVDGWLYLIGDEPVAQTPMVTAGASGSEILIVHNRGAPGEPDTETVYFLTSTGGKGYVVDRKDSNNAQRNIGDNMYVFVHYLADGTLVIDPPKDATRVNEPLIEQARAEYAARPH